MSLPLYQYINIRSTSVDELNSILRPDMNMRHPVVLDMKSMDLDQQRETIGLVEIFFISTNLSYRFPYPVYILSDHEMSISKMPIVCDKKNLPKFFSQRESKMNVKEAHMAEKNKLLQQEVKNSDASSNISEILNYGESHKVIYQLEKQRIFYRSILNDLMKVKKNG